MLARGVDIPSVNLVVNFDLPEKKLNRQGDKGPDMECYAHRIARCARAGKRGVVINFVHTQRDRAYISETAKHWSNNPDPNFLIPQFKDIRNAETNEVYESSMTGFQQWFKHFQAE